MMTMKNVYPVKFFILISDKKKIEGKFVTNI